MKLNKEIMKEVLNYVIEQGCFDFEDGKIKSIYVTSIVNALSNSDESKKEEIAFAIIRCIHEGFILSSYPRSVWATAEIIDITLRGFSWLEQN